MAKHFQVDTNGTLTTSLVSYWNMEGNSNDYYGSNNGTDTSVSYGSSYGKVNQGAYYNGSAITTISGVSALSPSSFSIALWFKTSMSGRGAMLSDYTGVSKGFILQIGWNGSSVAAGVVDIGIYNGSTGYDLYSSSAYNDGNWHLVVVTFDGSTVALYIDNSLQGTKSATIAYDGTPAVDIGSGYWSSARQLPFTGDEDEIGFWSKVLSTQERTDLYNGGSGQTMVSATTFSRAASTTMMNSASRYATSSYQHFINWVRTASVTMMNAASRTAVASYQHFINWVRTASVSMMNSASRYASVSWSTATVWIRTASVSMMNSASRFAKASKSFIIKISNKIRWDFFTWD